MEHGLNETSCILYPELQPNPDISGIGVSILTLASENSTSNILSVGFSKFSDNGILVFYFLYSKVSFRQPIVNVGSK